MVTNSNILGEDGDNRSMVMEVFAVRLAVVKGGDQWSPAAVVGLFVVVVVVVLD